jgi:hypothetical protein
VLRRASLSAAVLLGLLWLADAGQADLRKAEKTRYSVRQILVVQYSTKFCRTSNGIPHDFAYKVNSWSRRWSRRSTRRDVSSAQFLAQAWGFKCDGDIVKQRSESSWDPCFGCDGNSRRWTPDYQGSPGWPYVFTAEQAENYPTWNLRFKLVGTVASRTSGTLGDICTRITLFGVAATC